MSLLLRLKVPSIPCTPRCGRWEYHLPRDRRSSRPTSRVSTHQSSSVQGVVLPARTIGKRCTPSAVKPTTTQTIQPVIGKEEINMITLDQAKALKRGDILHHPFNKNKDGTCQRWKVNGKVQTWKRSPWRVRVPVRCGLRLYGYVDELSLDYMHLPHWRCQ